MKIDFTQALLGIDDKPLKITEEIDGERVSRDMLLSDVATTALMASPPERETYTGKQMLEADDLAREIFKAKEPIELKAAQITMLQERIAKVYQNPRAVAPAWRALEGPKEEPKGEAPEGGAVDHHPV